MDASVVQNLAPALQHAPAQTKQPQQQCELLASPGHVLLAQADVLRNKVCDPLILGAVGLGLVVASRSSRRTWDAPLARWSAGSTALGATLVPRKRRPRIPRRPCGPFTVLDAGLRLDAAEVASSPTSRSVGGAGHRDGGWRTAACCYRTDGSRLWVWGSPSRIRTAWRAVAALIRKDNAGVLTLHSVALPGTARLPAKPSLDPALVPRAVTAWTISARRSTNHGERRRHQHRKPLQARLS